MLFNSYVFIFLFLPLALVGFGCAGRWFGPRGGIAWLVLASLAFYGYWSLKDLALIIVLTFFNYGLGLWQNRSWDRRGQGDRVALIFGIAADLAILGYFKYTDLAIMTTNAVSGASIPLMHIVLPLGISFYTFQKIAFLVDAYEGDTREFDFLDYCLFVTFFPQLIAGPIVHHHDVISQFKAMTGRLRSIDLAVGLTIFVFGLSKKVLIADNLAGPANAVFDAVKNGGHPTFGEAWMGVLAYSGQLYFDFSGYSDMAIGLARMFSIRMPINFNSPYQSGDIIEFWRRWHMTLSRFLRDYLYISLGGNRKGAVRRHVNLLLTMLIGGLWHGANWTFLVWGGLHGIYLIICHGWKALRQRLGWTNPGRWAKALGVFLTFVAVMVSWVFFRAESFASAMTLIRSMFGFNGFELSLRLARWIIRLVAPFGITPGKPSNYYDSTDTLFLVVALVLIFAMPNTMRIMRDAEPVLDGRMLAPTWFSWRMNRFWAAVVAVLALASLLSLTRISHFLYFQF